VQMVVSFKIFTFHEANTCRCVHCPSVIKTIMDHKLQLLKPGGGNCGENCVILLRESIWGGLSTPEFHFFLWRRGGGLDIGEYKKQRISIIE
jgi:hypothetical protein